MRFEPTRIEGKIVLDGATINGKKVRQKILPDTATKTELVEAISQIFIYSSVAMIFIAAGPNVILIHRGNRTIGLNTLFVKPELGKFTVLTVNAKEETLATYTLSTENEVGRKIRETYNDPNVNDWIVMDGFENPMTCEIFPREGMIFEELEEN